jgi:aspartyl/glutamyl-tRNA(Asn/Gln) amidotransferase C subunit
MDKFSEENIIYLANTLKFSLTKEEVERIKNDSEYFVSQIKLLDKIPNLDNEDEMVFPFDVTTDKLYEDEPETPLTKEEVLALAADTYDGQVRVPKVVKK